MAKKKDKTKPDAEGTEGKKKSKKKLVLIGLLVVVLGGGGYVYMGKSKKPVASATGGPPTTVAGTLIEETSLTVNLRDGHYLQFTVAFDVAAGQSATILATDSAVVLDTLNAQASAMTEPELLAPGGKAKLKAGIVAAMNQEWPGLISTVFFEQFTMQ